MAQNRSGVETDIDAWVDAHTTDTFERRLARFYLHLPLVGRLIFWVARGLNA